jgi:hypothetical protein
MKPSVLFPVRCLWRVLLVPALAVGVAFAADSTASGWTHFTICNPLPGSQWGTAGLPLVDLDKDGDLDVALSRRDAHGFYWYERRSDSNWVQHTICDAPEIEQGLGAAALDVDGDGWTDLVFSGVWFRNPGTPALRSDRPWPHHRFEGGGHDILDADVNGDGREDIVTFDGKTLAWFDTAQNLEKIVLASEIDHHGGLTPRGAGDIDGDGDLDLVIAGSWFENPGKGRGGWSRHAWPHLGVPNASYGISIRSWVVDLDRDGSQDIVYSDCDTGNGHVYWVRNLGRGKEWNRVRLTDPPTGPGNVPGTGSWHSLAVADFDGDGDLDVFGGEQEDPDTYMTSAGKVPMKPPGLKERGVIWVNDGGQPAQFRPTTLHEDNPGWHDAAVGDVDGDGDPDLVSKIWNKDGPTYHADFWRNDRRKAAAGVRRAAASNAWNTVTVTLPAQPSPTALLPDSPFGINTSTTCSVPGATSPSTRSALAACRFLWARARSTSSAPKEPRRLSAPIPGGEGR